MNVGVKSLRNFCSPFAARRFSAKTGRNNAVKPALSPPPPRPLGYLLPFYCIARTDNEASLSIEEVCAAPKNRVGITDDSAVKTFDSPVKTFDSPVLTFDRQFGYSSPPCSGRKLGEMTMARSSDWLPGSRTGIQAMCRNWLAYMTAERRTAWEIPQDQFTELQTLFGAAETLLQKAQDEAERTHVITVECHAAFTALVARMRFFRNRFFKMPPLTEGDWAALGFRQKDAHQTTSGAPDGLPSVSLSYPGGSHVITAHLGPMPGTLELDAASDYGYAIYVGIMPKGGATLEQAASDKHYLMKIPADGKSLQHYRFTRRKKEKIFFDAGDGGMTVYVCCRYENRKGDEGKWGPVASIIIP
jgi:hypothetical protein